MNVLVIFSSCSGATEKLALAAAVGAVQARANIRMRRLPESCEDRAEWKETLAHMRREYVPPAQADAIWADAVIIGLNRKICGRPFEPADATTFGREQALSFRERADREAGG